MNALTQTWALVKSELTQSRRFVIALVLYWGYIHVLLYSRTFNLALGESLPLLEQDQVWTISLSANFITVMVLAFHSWRHDSIWLERTQILLRFSPSSLGIVLIAAFVLLGQPAAPLFVIGSALTGIGLGFAVAYFGFILSRKTLQCAVLDIALAMLGNAVFCVLLSAMDDWLVFTIMICCPIAIAVLLSYSVHEEQGITATTYVGEGITSDEVRSFLVSLMLSALIVGFSLGVIRNLMFASLTWSTSHYLLFILGVFVTGLLLLPAIPSLGRDRPWALIFIAILIIATAFLLMIFIPEDGAPTIQFVHTVGFYFFDALFWAFCAKCAGLSRTAIRLFVTAYGANQLGQLLGTFAGIFFHANAASSNSGYSLTPVIMVYLLMAFTVMILMRMSKSTLFSSSHPSLDQFETACNELALSYRLSPRETKILELLAKGRDRAYVAQECAISVETVKTYISRIYKKLGIHSRQDLLDLVESRIESQR